VASSRSEPNQSTLYGSATLAVPSQASQLDVKREPVGWVEEQDPRRIRAHLAWVSFLDPPYIPRPTLHVFGDTVNIVIGARPRPEGPKFTSPGHRPGDRDHGNPRRPERARYAMGAQGGYRRSGSSDILALLRNTDDSANGSEYRAQSAPPNRWPHPPHPAICITGER